VIAGKRPGSHIIEWWFLGAKPEAAMRPLTLRIGLSPGSSSTAAVVERLQNLGFSIIDVSRTGALVTAPRELIEATFGSKVVVDGQNARFASTISFDKIGVGEGIRAYFPTEPTYFGG
jgi:hypothetical protein